MRKGDGSLVVFTLLSQWSVGIVVCLAGLAVFTDAGSIAVDRGFSLANPVLLALLLIVFATTVSFLHLGNPVNAPKAIRNLATSWLSREILGIGLYVFCLLALLASERAPAAGAYRHYLLAACSAAGLFLVWAMARVYRIPTVPAWDSGFTALGFLSASLGLGSISWLLLDALGVAALPGRTRTYLTGLLIAVLTLEMGAGFVNHYRLTRMDTGIDGPSFGSGILKTLFHARMAVVFLACLVMLRVLRLEPAAGSAALPWLCLAAALVVLQVSGGRVLFYSSYFRTGL